MVETLETRFDGSVLTVTLNRPDVRNAFNSQMIAELTELFRGLRERDDVRVVVLEGSGKSFSAGADVNWMRSSLEFSDQQNREDALRMSDMFLAIDSLPKPVVARVHGAALGGGMGLIAVSDVVVAAEDTLFGFTEVKLGIIPAVISRFVLPKIGESWARALFLTGERFGADLAQTIGLVHFVASTEGLDGLVRRKVEDLLSSGPQAALQSKALIGQWQVMDAEAFRFHTVDTIARLRVSPEGQEGLRAFLEKRSPAWGVEGR